MRKSAFLRWLALVLCACVALQLYFVVRIALMAVLAPESTSFQRSEAWAQATQRNGLHWRQDWMPYERISDHLKRAVIASEDDGFTRHDGIDWNAIEKAWERNAIAQAKADAQAQKLAQKSNSNAKTAAKSNAQSARLRTPKIVGGSTITQQLTKNLMLSPERTFLRKGQEFVLTLLLEQLLSKERILEIYLNSVEWGDGVFGAEAAAQRYFGKSASKLTAHESAQLAVMLPAPKRFEKNPRSAYILGRSRTILARMGAADTP